MSDDLRPQIVHLAASFPIGSSERTTLLRIIGSSGVEFAGTASEDQKERFARDLSKVAEDAGDLTYLRIDAPGNGWLAVFSTEFAALRVHYKWRNVRGVNFGKLASLGGWYVSVTR